jgi:2-succinyl-6-hydroxy-2,4-cyclohexadiene-1-carboxylate synthase
MLHYDTYGSADQPALCLLHGFMGTGRDWEPVASALAQDAYCLTVDLPGHGRSTGRPRHEYSMEGATQALADVLDEAGVERCTVVGYSMGGRLALYLAAFQPDRVKRLVLESASPGFGSAEARRRRRETDEERARRIEADLTGFLEDWYRQPLFASLERHGLVESMVERRAANDPAELAAALRGLGPGQQPSLWEAVGGLAMPTLAITGALDQKYVGLTKRMRRANAALRRVVVPRAGHNVHAERPQAFLVHLVRFLADT